MQYVANVSLPILQNQPKVPQDVKDRVSALMQGMAQKPDIDPRSLTQYKPEYAWNYEIGSHCNLINHRLHLDMAVFLTEVRDQQVSRMAENGLGRITVNAGRSRAVGCELAASVRH